MNNEENIIFAYSLEYDFVCGHLFRWVARVWAGRVMTLLDWHVVGEMINGEYVDIEWYCHT